MWSITERLKTALSIPESDILRIAPGVVAVNTTREAAIDAYIATRADYTAYRWWWRRAYRCKKVFVANDQFAVVLYDPDAAMAIAQSDRAAITLGAARSERYTITSEYPGVSLVGTSCKSSLVWMAVRLFFAQNAEGQWVAGPFAQNEKRPVYGIATKSFGYDIGETYNISSSDWNIVGFPAADMAPYGHSAGAKLAYYPLTKVGLPASTNVGWRLIEGPAFLSHGEFFNGIGFVVAHASHISKWARKSGGVTFPDVQVNLDKFADGIVGSSEVSYVWCSVPGGTNPYNMIPDCKPVADELLATSGKQGEIDLGLVRSNMAKGGEFVAAVETYRKQTVLSGSVNVVLDARSGIKMSITTTEGVVGPSELCDLDLVKATVGEYLSSGRAVLVDKSAMSSVQSTDATISEKLVEFQSWYAGASMNARVSRSNSDISYPEICGNAMLAAASDLVARKDRTAISILLRPGMLSDRVAQGVFLSVANQ